MTVSRSARAGALIGARAAIMLAALMTVVGLTGGGPSAAAADGPNGSPALRPPSVESPTAPFTLVPPLGARCEEDGSGAGAPGPRTGSDGWRWHTFIVEAGRDLSTLEFGPIGPGDDYDASDGSITASLIAKGRGVWSEPPAEQPEGFLDPTALGSLRLEPSDYTLTDGRYLLGFACTDEASATRQWWSLEVTIRTSGAPFMVPTAGTAPEAGDEPVAAPPSGRAGPEDPDTLAAAAAEGVDRSADEPVDVQEAQIPSPSGASVSTPVVGTGTVGVTWSPLAVLHDVSSVLPAGAWAAIGVLFARACYLLARPVTVLPLVSP